MPKGMNWARARKRTSYTDADWRTMRLDRKADQILARAPAPKPPIQNTEDQRSKRHRRKHGTNRAIKFHWPIYVTHGQDPFNQGALKVITLSSRQEADRCGYAWAGK